MTQPVPPDPVDDSDAALPQWVEIFKALTRPSGCWVVYALTAWVLTHPPVDVQALVSEIGFLTFGWGHVFQFTWARSTEKRANAAEVNP